MNKTHEGVIKYLKEQLKEVCSSIDWHAYRLREFNEKAINLKETIAELESRLNHE